MALELNSKRETYKVFPKEGTAPNTKQMPKLIADSRVPANTAQLMQRRLDVRNDEDLTSSYMDNYFDTGDAIVCHPDGRVKVVLDSQDLRDMTPTTPINRGALIITPEAYRTLQGEEFKKGNFGKTGEWMSREDVKAHPIWKALARGQGLLNDYTDFIFAEGKQRFGYDKAMGIYTTSANGDTLEMRAWCVCRLENRSLADGWDYLDNDGGRFLGIAPEAQGAIGKGVGGVKAYTMNDLQEAEKQLDNLSQVVKSESLEKVRSLVGKLQF